jgi:hypothetical protein
MAIAPSKLGRLVADCWSSEEAYVRGLRGAGLIRQDVSDEDLLLALEAARREDEALPEGQRLCNSPNERVRVFLGPYLSTKGQEWAVPLDSLDIPDDQQVVVAAGSDVSSMPQPAAIRRPWWRFW